MSEKRIKNLTALAVWAIIQGYFLAFHFSWGNAAVMAVGLLVLSLTMLFGGNKDRANVVDNLVRLLVVSFLVFMGYFIVSDLVPMFADAGDRVVELVLSRLEMGMNWLGNRMEFMPVTGMLLLLFFITGRSKKHPLLKILSPYLFWTVLMLPFYKAWCDSFAMTVMMLLLALIFAVCDIYDYLRCDLPSTAGKRWYRFLTVLLLVFLLLKPDALQSFARPGFMEKYFILDGFKWYTVLLLAAVFFGAAYVMWKMDRKEGVSGIGTDACVFWNAAWIVVAAFFMTRFYVGYWWVIALGYCIGMGYAIVALHPKKTEGYARKRKLSYLFVPAMTALLVILTVAGHSGRLLSAAVLLASAAGVMCLWKRTDFSADTWKDKAWFYTGVLLAVALNAVTALVCFRQLPSNFILLAGIFVVCTVFVWFLSLDSGLLSRKSHFARAAVVAVFVIACLSLCGEGGSKIQLQTKDEQAPTVMVTPRGKDNSVKKIEYYWLDDYLSLDEMQSDFPEETRIFGGSIPEKDGRLRVVVVDANGIKTEQIYWFHTCQYVEGEEIVENNPIVEADTNEAGQETAGTDEVLENEIIEETAPQ